MLVQVPIFAPIPRLTEAGRATHRRNAAIRRASACIVHVGRESDRRRVRLIGGRSCRRDVLIVILGAKGSIGGAGGPRGPLSGAPVPARVPPASRPREISPPGA